MILVSRNRTAPDATDLKIIEFLRKNARTSKREIANKLNISRQTVQKRISVLEEKGIIKFTCSVDERFLGKEMTAIILIILDRTRRLWSVTARELWSRRHEFGIIEMHHVTGNYDIVLVVRTEVMRSLEKNLAGIAAIEGVSTTRTMVCMSSYDSAINDAVFDIADIEQK